MLKPVRPLIGLDLDGVLALENRDHYFKAKAEGHTALRTYYRGLRPNELLMRKLFDFNTLFEYKIFTARQNDLQDIKDITVGWAYKHCSHINPDGWPPEIVFTKFKWKALEVYKHGCAALIDNDLANLSRVPFIKRYAYNFHIPIGHPIIPVLSTPLYLLGQVDRLTKHMIRDFYE
jgi:hypothetical protein